MNDFDRSSISKVMRHFIIGCIISPSSILSLMAFVSGYCWPNISIAIHSQAQQIGLHDYINQRVLDSEFSAAAYLFWYVTILTLPIQAIWIYREGKRHSMTTVARAFMLLNLQSKDWEPKKYTLLGGYIRITGYTLVALSFTLGPFFLASEPSTCKGCETGNAQGFIFFNLVPIHLFSIFIYLGIIYLISWKFVQTHFGEPNE